MIDRGGGEVLVALVGEASPPRGTYEVLHVPWELHTACCEQIEAAATTLDACVTQPYASAAYQRTVLLVRAVPRVEEEHIEVRVAIVGNVDAGKSTLLGVLTKGALDDGRGRARVGLFRHKHELDTGRTSSVGTEVMGFRADGHPVVELHADSTAARRVAWEPRSCRLSTSRATSATSRRPCTA